MGPEGISFKLHICPEGIRFDLGSSPEGIRFKLHTNAGQTNSPMATGHRLGHQTWESMCQEHGHRQWAWLMKEPSIDQGGQTGINK